MGEHAQAIALNGYQRKPVLIRTVFRHVLTALQHGMCVDFAKLIDHVERAPPNEEEWNQIQEAAAKNGRDPTAEDYRRSEVVREILGDPDTANQDDAHEAEAQRALNEHWGDLVNWWEALTRV